MRTQGLRSLAEILGSRVLIVVFAAITDVLVARTMDLTDRGLFAALQGSVLLLAGLCTLGLEYGFLLSKDLPGLSTLLVRYRRSAFVLGPLGGVLVAGFIWRYELNWWQALATGMITAGEIFTILLLPLVLQYRGSGSFGVIRILRRALLFAGIGLVALIPGLARVSLGAALLIHALAWAAGAVLALVYVARAIPSAGSAPAPRLLQLWRQGASVFLAKYAERAQSRVGLLVLGMASKPEAAAMFAVASLAVDLSIFVASSLSIAVITRRGNASLLGGRELKTVGLALMGLNLLVGVAVWYLAEPLIAVIYGEKYMAVGGLVRLLVPGLVAYGAYPLYSTHLLKIGRTRLVLASNFGALALNLGVSLLLLLTGNRDPASAAVIGLLVGLLVNVASIAGMVLVRK